MRLLCVVSVVTINQFLIQRKSFINYITYLVKKSIASY